MAPGNHPAYPPYPPPPGQYPPLMYPQGQYPPGQHAAHYGPQLHVHAQRRGMGAGKIILVIVGSIGMLMFGSCMVCTVMVGAGANAVAEAEKKEAAQAKTCEGTPEVSWQALSAQMKANEIAVVSSWKGQCQRVTGVVDGLNAGIGDAPQVLIDGGGELEFDKLHCQGADKAKAGTLRKGQEISVWGIGGSEIAGSLFLEHCDWE